MRNVFPVKHFMNGKYLKKVKSVMSVANLLNKAILFALLIVAVAHIVRYLIFLYRKAKVLKEEEPIYSRISDARLDGKIAHIQEKIRQKRICLAGVYTVPEEIRKELQRDKFSPDALQRLVDSIVLHTGVFNLVEVKVEDARPGNVVGLYTTYGRMVREVQLYRNKKYSVQQIIAILIHECTHNFLYYHDLELPSEEENEILTDVTAVCLGFGRLLLEGYKPVKEIAEERYEDYAHGIRVHKWRIGYLKLPDLVYVIKAINC